VIRNSNNSGIYVLAATNLVIQKNEFISVGTGASHESITLFSGTGVKIYHNTIYNSFATGIDIATGASNISVRNNIFVSNPTAAINDPNDRLTALSNNLYFSNGANCVDSGGGLCAGETGTVATDPLFVNAGSNDFTLTECTSPAIDAGVDLTPMQAWTKNGALYDLGAHETSCSTGSIISGRVFEDANFNGTAATFDGAIDDIKLASVDVELYDNSNVYISSTTTDVDGLFSFGGVADGTYKLRVRSASINGGVGLAEMTGYKNAAATWVDLYGGQSATVSDNATGDNAGPGDTYISLTVSGSDITGLEFGFAYNLIVNVADSGQGSLRQFINNVNASAAYNRTSQFRMQVATNQTDGADNWWRISPTTQLTTFFTNSSNAIIDASTQRTNSASDSNTRGPEIEINGASCTTCSAFYATSGTNITIREFAINGFDQYGIHFTNTSTNNQIMGNYIGVNAIGTATSAITSHAIYLQGTGNIIGSSTAADRNIISGSANGVYAQGTFTDLTIQGNYIGTGADGTTAIGNSTRGVLINTSAASSNILVGGVNSGEGNIIANTTNTAGSEIYLQIVGGNNEVSGNTIKQVNGIGLYLFNTTALTIQKNIFYDDAIGDVSDHGIYVWDGDNVNIYHNTFYKISGDVINAAGAGGSNFKVINNIFSENVGWAILDSVPVLSTLSNNNYYLNVSGVCSGANCGIDTNSITTNPNFSNAPAADFSLVCATSSADNSGLDLDTDADGATVQPDMNGASAGKFNSSAPDMGAVESSCVAGIIVTNNNDSGAGSLRQAMLDVAAGETITFDTGVFDPNTPVTITLASNLPAISLGTITIDASDAGVIVDGANFYTAINISSSNNIIKGLQIQNILGSGISISSGTGNTIGGDSTAGAVVANKTHGEGNIIINNSSHGINIATTGNFVYGNLIGIDATDAIAANTSNGVNITANSNTIGSSGTGQGNVISGNGGAGVYLNASSSNSIQGNKLGVDSTGTLAKANSFYGIHIVAASTLNTIGGNTAAQRNIISANGSDGILITGAGTDSNTIKGNYIGTDVNGTAVLGNGNGILIMSGAQSNIIGGSAAGEGNLISGNSAGINITGTGTDFNEVYGNLIGTDATGTLDLGNTSSGIRLLSSSASNIIGGITAGARNIISGNNTNAIQLSSNNNTIQGNYIGLNITGDAAIINGSGIIINDPATGNIIGGSVAGAANLISGNTNHGIMNLSTGTTDIQGNYIGTNTVSDALPNGLIGIFSNNGTINLGKTGDALANIIATNGDDGIQLQTGTILLGHIVDVNDIIDLQSGTLNLSDATLNLSADWLNTAASITVGTSTVTLDGSALQTITTAAGNFNNLTVTNASVAGVSFADGFSVANFTNITASSKMTFAAGATY
ncbi:MAG: right-handed parallel beta-helix repeat-containing protein, partial [Gammaproteobacteria bacterium]|nr:right-handed parallel beta-helix repeat-containing protein [Gammaproteobacteria bacterium]